MRARCAVGLIRHFAREVRRDKIFAYFKNQAADAAGLAGRFGRWHKRGVGRSAGKPSPQMLLTFDEHGLVHDLGKGLGDGVWAVGHDELDEVVVGLGDCGVVGVVSVRYIPGVGHRALHESG